MSNNETKETITRSKENLYHKHIKYGYIETFVMF